MAKSRTVLHQEVIRRLRDLKTADILVGIPSFRNAKTIADVVSTASEGLARHFSGLRAVIVNSDGGSEDRTREVVLETPVAPGIEKIVTPYRGPAGKGSAFHTIFEIADRLKVKVAIVVDSDLRSITPEWIRLLGEPIYKHNFGFVTPYYFRYKYDGTITNAIAYPLTRALYGQMIRQPIGGEFALTGSLAKVFSHQDIWSSDIARFGIDIWMTTTAINEGFRVCQASMGVKLHDAKDPSSDLGPMFRQVVGTLFTLMKKYQVKWKAVRGSQPVDLFGHWPAENPEPIAVDLHALLTKFKDGFERERSALEAVLSPENFAAVEGLTGEAEKVFRFPLKLWARSVYDFAVAYNFSPTVAPDAVVAALIPLYYGRTASFVLETEVMVSIETERCVEKTAETFEAEKLYLIDRWDRAQEPRAAPVAAMI